MIPSEVVVIAKLIWSGWADLPDEEFKEVLDAAWRIYLAGYRRRSEVEEGPPMSQCEANLTAQTIQVNRLRSVLESLTRDPPATLDEPDTDFEIIQKMRAIARDAL